MNAIASARVRHSAVVLSTLLAMTGCMVTETRPQSRVNPTQAQQQIPADELLDVAIREFDAGIPASIAKDDEALAKKRIYTDLRKAEASFMPTRLRSTLEASGQWGAVRVVPRNVEFVDVLVDGRIIESTGARLELEITVRDSMGRVWIDKKSYEARADLGSYKTDAALKARDPFQNAYSQIANDMVAARERLLASDRREIRRVTSMKFAQDLAPDALQGYLATEPKSGVTRLNRLPAADDPLLARIERIRDRDAGVVDTVDGYYGAFSEKMNDSYGAFRRTSFDAIEKEERTRSQARTRTVLGAAAVLAAIFVPNQCSAGDYNCQRVEDAARYGGTIGGTAAVLSGIKKYAEAKNYAQELKELSNSFQNEVASQVVDLEGRTLKLTGTAEEQYREWRRLLGEIYREDTAGTAKAPEYQPSQ